MAKVEKVGKAFIVDPNPPGMEIVPPEDLFIYVKFSAYPRSRVTYGGQSLEGNTITFNNGIEDEVHFISTKIRYDSASGKLDPPLQKTYATTDWTNIGGFNASDTKSAGVLEGFGIKSIDIKYNASLVPTVDITFTDVRGGALFDVIKDNDRLSPYSVFFKMPYPVFNLSVKGYFGQKVDFCLHMVNWTSSFDGNTGNFDITANFLGFQQAFLNDMVLGNIIGAVNTTEGYNNLNRIFEESGSEVGKTIPAGSTLEDLRKNGDLNIRKIDDFFTQISKLQVESEIIKSEINSFQLLKDLNGKLSLLKTLRSFIGPPLQKEPKSSSGGSNQKNTETTPYLETENRTNIVQSSPIKDDELIINKNYLSIRDFIVFNSVNRVAFKSFISTLNSIVSKYEEYLSSGQRVKNKPDNSLEIAKELNIKKTQKIKENETVRSAKDEELIKSFKDKGLDENSWEKYIVSPTLDTNANPDPKRLDVVLSSFFASGSSINLKNNYDKGPDTNSGFNIELFKKQVKDKLFYSPTTNLLESSNVLVADFRKQRALVEDSILELEEIIKIQKEVVQEEINAKLTENFKREFNFNPTIGKCFEIIANNTQAMVETIYDISTSAEEKSKSNARSEILRTYETDVPTGINGVAWPSVYQKSDKGDLEEIYIGEVPGINTSDFPELDFVERVFENIVGKTKTLEDVTKASVLKNGLDTDNWLPINPIDYKVNPWIKLNSLNDLNSIGNELVEKFFTRVALLNNYSLFDSTTGLRSLEEYARIESIAANKTIFSQKARLIISNVLKDLEAQLKNPNTPVIGDEIFNFKKSDFYTKFLLEENNFYVISEENEFQKIGDFNISGKFSDKVEYILFDDKSIINNSKKLFQEIRDDEVYRKLTDPAAGNLINKELKGPKFYKNFYSGANNLTTYNAYNVWYTDVANEILKSSGNVILGDLSKAKLQDINPSGATGTGKYLNITYFNQTDTGTTEYGTTMIETDLYEGQTSNYARALLLLSTLPYRSFKDGFLQSVFDSNSFRGARIINLPKLYVYYIGALLWRYETNQNGSDPLNFNISSLSGATFTKFASPSNCYLSKIGFGATKTDRLLEDELIYLPKSVKNKLINNFKNWVDNENFNSTYNGVFEKNVKTYVPDLQTASAINKQETDLSKSYILARLKETTDLILLNPEVFDPVQIAQYQNNKGLIVDKNSVLSYVTSFKQKFNEVEQENNNGQDNNNEIKNDNKSTNIIKLQLYNYFKNINNKWVGSEEKSFNICGDPKSKNLIDYFRFIDRGWRFIGDEATFNLKSFLTLGSNLNTSVYFFISKLLRDSNFLFQILPTYVNFKNAEEVAKMFQPLTTLQYNDSSGPIFCCIYVGGASQVLDIGERSNYYFKNDGFSLTASEIPADLIDDNKSLIDNNGNVGIDETSLVAFRVAFGAQNQTVFKNVSMSQQEHRETGEYFKALSDLIDKRGGTQKTYVGTDLLRLFKTRSYTCKVDAMGCMNIQPLMYFDLQNVPFFNGAYLITSVSHNISPNQMSTSFEGVRQSKYITSPSKQITADLDIDLNESSETPKIEFTNLNNKNSLYTIGVLNPTDKFDFDVNFTIDRFKNLGVTNFTDERLTEIIADLRTQMENENVKIITNSQVTMFLSSMLSNSENLLNKEMPWDIENKETFVNRFPSFDPVSPDKIKYYGTTTSSDKYLLSQPVYSSGTVDDISFNIPGNDELKEFLINDRIEKRKSEINQKLPTLDVSVATQKTEKEKLEKELKKLEEEENNLINTTKYFNIFEGDAYRFRPRGYLYVVGRKQYTDILGDVAQAKPYNVSASEFDAIFVSIKVWKELKDGSKKSSYDYSSLESGSASIYKKCVELSQQYKSKGSDNAFIAFEKVLTTFTNKNGEPLINYFNPGP